MEICILAGGLSERMGRDKSRLRLGRRTMLGLIQTTAKTMGMKVRVIRRDLVPRCGPLGGICSGLKTTKADAVIFLACDMPFITTAIIQQLAEFAARHPARSAFLRTRNEFTFPLLVPREALPAVASQIKKQSLSLQSLARKLRAKPIACPPKWAACVQNINTPADLHRAKLHLAEGE